MNKKTSSAGKVAAGLGVAALAAAAAGAYYFAGPSGKKHRNKLNSWAKKAKDEMLQKIKAMKTVSKRAYEDASREVLAKYKQAKNIDPKELADLGREIKGHWDKISRDAAKLGKRKTPRSPRRKKTAK